MRSQHQRPYKVFGEKLRTLRELAKESLLEVSGAVEIDESVLKEIEMGNKLPDEDILILLMNHFDVADKDAVKLWELAGYDKEEKKIISEDIMKQVMFVMPVENKAIYADSATVEATKKGVMIDFAQGTQAVSKIGMSLEQAKQLLNDLQAKVVNAEKPKVQLSLPAPKQNQKNSK